MRIRASKGNGQARPPGYSRRGRNRTLPLKHYTFTPSRVPLGFTGARVGGVRRVPIRTHGVDVRVISWKRHAEAVAPTG